MIVMGIDVGIESLGLAVINVDCILNTMTVIACDNFSVVQIKTFQLQEAIDNIHYYVASLNKDRKCEAICMEQKT